MKKIILFNFLNFYLMKNIFILLSVLFLCVFSSCEKEKCKDCSCSQIIYNGFNVSTQTGAPDVTQNVEFNDVFCDQELEEIEGTRTYIVENEGGFSQTVEESCDCK